MPCDERTRGIEDKLDYKLLITDIDGTLVDSRQEVPEANQAAIARLMAAGGLFTFATGRNEEAALPYVRGLAVNAPPILYNGAKVVDLRRSETVFERRLPLEETLAVLAISASFEVSVNLYLSRGIYVEEITPAVREYMAKDRVACVEVGDLSAFLGRAAPGATPTKLLIIGEEHVVEGLREAIGASLPALSLARSERTYLEVLPPGVSKGVALEALCAYLGLDRRRVVAMGDAPNDIELIEAAGLGIAVANAHPSLKERARFVAPRNEDCAVAEVIRRFFGV